MATVIIPTRTDGLQRYSMSTPLDGVTFGLEFVWNARNEAWSLIVSDSEGEVLARVKLVLGVPLLSRFASWDLPAGEFVLIDTSGADEEPGLTDLGSRVLLTYAEAADVVAAAA